MMSAMRGDVNTSALQEIIQNKYLVPPTTRSSKKGWTMTIGLGHARFMEEQDSQLPNCFLGFRDQHRKGGRDDASKRMCTLVDPTS